MITVEDRVELVALYHMAKVAIGGYRYERMCWAADKFAKEHDVKPIQAYKALDYALIEVPV